MFALLLPVALANGLSTHAWIAAEARQHVVPGELHDFINDPALEDYLRNGAQFPDGGYAVGSAYGETAHWEPAQGAYLEWIRATYGGPPYEGEAAHHVAFLLGMSAHGISDQTHDAQFLERSYVYDADSDWANHSIDEADDVTFSAVVGAQPVPPTWVPADVMVEVFASQGIDVEAATFEQGQQLTGVAIGYVGAVSQNPDSVAMYHDQFPWAGDHIADETVPGSPPTEARVTAKYWEQIWGRLAGTWTFDEPLMYVFPEDGYLRARTAGDVEARVTFVMTRGLDVSTLLPGVVTVEDSAGHVYVPEPSLYYGQNSQTVNLIPGEDWAADEDFVVTVAPGIATIGGDVSTEPFTFTFTTREPEVGDTGDMGDTGDGGETGCGCASGGGGVGWMVVMLAGMGVRRRRSEGIGWS